MRSLSLIALAGCLLASPARAQDAPGRVEGASVNPHGPLELACEACHTATAWTPLRETLDFDHDGETGFPLVGRHLQASCTSCHLDLRFDAPRAVPSDCATCHIDVHLGTLGETCQTCHEVTDFSLVNGEAIHAQTAFPLSGSHLQVDCRTCHEAGAGGSLGPSFGPIPTDCYACHADDYAATTGTSIDHVASGLPTTCETCHSTVSFATNPFDHTEASGGFELVGAHIPLPCSACHTSTLGPLYQPSASDDCQSCHADDAAAARPNHDGFPTTCTTCHVTEAWQGVSIDHVALSDGFALVGAHLTLDCAACHTEADYGVPWTPAGDTDCQSCHAEAAATAQPDHTGFPTTCTTCHTTTRWEGATVDHVEVSSGFDLVGAHLSLACAACHTGADYSVPWDPTSDSDCQSCHEEDAAAAQPSHASFPTTCTTCHATTSWKGATIDHPTVSGGFELVGAHLTLDCATCHSGPDFGVPWTPTGDGDCQSCHTDDAASAQPDHQAFPTTCATCHTTTSWDGATIDHPTVSGGFELVGAHLTLDCAACHSGPDFGVPWAPTGDGDCQSCHADDAASAQPSHTAFPTTCTTCHSTTSWTGATVDHPAVSGGFELVGAHIPLACTACHSGANYEVPWQPTSQTDCYSCHETDYQNEHSGSGFPTTCLDCHTVTTWDGATFAHTAFPIYSGRHAGEWDTCQTCHVQPNDFTVFSCVNCHEHRQSEADSEHREVNGYVYESTACYTCHPDGRD